MKLVKSEKLRETKFEIFHISLKLTGSELQIWGIGVVSGTIYTLLFRENFETRVYCSKLEILNQMKKTKISNISSYFGIPAP